MKDNKALGGNRVQRQGMGQREDDDTAEYRVGESPDTTRQSKRDRWKSLRNVKGGESVCLYTVRHKCRSRPRGCAEGRDDHSSSSSPPLPLSAFLLS